MRCSKHEIDYSKGNIGTVRYGKKNYSELSDYEIVYIDEAINYDSSATPSTPTSPINYTSVWSSDVTKTDAQINANFDLTYISSSGFYIGTSSGSLTKVSKSLSGATDGAGNFKTIYYKMSKWYGALKTNTTYYYKLYVIKDGKEYCTEVKSFKTLPGTYSVTYNANGGSGAPAAQTKTQGQNLTLSKSLPTRSGYTFIGWATSSNGSVAYKAGDIYSNNAAVTLYAVWSKISISPKLNTNSISMSYKSETSLSETQGLNVSWSSSNTKVAIVDSNGTVYAVGVGNATITAVTADGKTDICTVNVTYAWWQEIIRIILFGWIWY